MSASGPHRQRSLRDRIHQGISSLTWQGKPTGKTTSNFTSYSHSSDDSTEPYILSASDNRSLSLDTHGYVNPLDWEVPSFNTNELKLGVNPLLPTQQSRPTQCVYTVSGSVTVGQVKAKSPQGIKLESDKKMVTRTITQPEGTSPFTVSASDTLAGIAARFYTTPSELAKINKLSSRLIFSGQTLYVPVRDVSIDEENPCVTPPTTPVEKQVMTPMSPLGQGITSIDIQSKPGHVERVVTPQAKEALKSEVTSPTLSQEEEERKLDEECHKKFLKVNVRHITDGQGVVPGVLLVTPNALMFDPNVSDALVIERGSDKYSVTCPMSMVANAAMYRDIAHMKLKNVPMCSDEDSAKIREVYHTEGCPKFQEKKDPETSDKPSDRQDENECSCSKSSVPGVIDETPAVAVVPQKANVDELEDLPKNEKTLVSQDLMDLSCNMECEEKAKMEITKDNEQIKTKLTNPLVPSQNIISEAKLDVSGPDEADLLLTSNPASSEKDSTSAEKLSKSAWYSQLSDIPHLPTQLDFSMFKSTKSENSDSLLSTSCSGSMEQPTSESHKIRLLKRLSQPVSWIESFASGSVDSAVEMTASAQSTLSKILPHAFSSSSDKDETPPSSAGLQPGSSQSNYTRHFSTSPQSFVDFSSGLFAQDSTDKVKDVSEICSAGQSKFYNAPEEPSMISCGKSSFLESTESTESAQSASRVFLDSNAANSESSSRQTVQIKNMVEENPNLFTSIDKLIPKPAASYDDPPLYLCLLMGHPPKPSGTNAQLNSHPPLHRHALMSYGQKCIKPEYWFSIPRDKVDELYAFFNMWAPGVYGDPSTIDFEAKGYKLIETDEELSDDEHDGGSKVSMNKSRPQSSPRSVGSLLKMVEEHFLAQSPFERESDSQVVSINEIPTFMSIDGELPLADMIGKSEILNDEHRQQISNNLPARAEGYPWRLLYSNCEHGFSLKTLYREMSKYECPALLTVTDTNNAMFGAMIPCSLKISEHFYGNGESFLFSFYPEFKCYNWTGENNYFIKGAADSLAFGAGEGTFGLWLDEDLYKGRSNKCLTYGNEILASSEDFIISGIEVWGFM